MIPRRHVKILQKCAHYANTSYDHIENSENSTYIYAGSTDTQSYIIVDGEDLVITGQGTTTLRDWAMDFQIWRTKVPYLNNVLVHTGFVKVYDSIKDELHTTITQILSKHNIQRILCTGHSLFGAIATIAAVHCGILYDLPIHCVSFGSPRVGYTSFVSLFNSVVDISYRCVRYKDPITFTPLPIRFRHVRGGLQMNITLSENISLHNCIGCRVKHHSMEEYYEFCKTL